MSDLLRPDFEYAPWHPARDVVLIKEFDRYDIPLSWLIEQAGCFYLFACLLGETDTANVWSYVQLTGGDVESLQRSTGDDLQDVIEQILRSRAQLVAVAFDWKLAWWTTVDEGLDGSSGVTRRFLDLLEQRNEREQEGTHVLEDRSELVDA